MGNIRTQDELSGLNYGVYQKTIWAETAFIRLVLTVIYISFAKIFCQNLVKKNCKLVALFSLLNVVIECEHG